MRGWMSGVRSAPRVHVAALRVSTDRMNDEKDLYDGELPADPDLAPAEDDAKDDDDDEDLLPETPRADAQQPLP